MNTLLILALASGLGYGSASHYAVPKASSLWELRPRPQRTVGIATRAATLEPSPPAFVNATAVFAWSDGIVYHAYTTPGRVTDIILQEGEVLGSVASGDTTRWVIGDTASGAGDGKRTHILVKPFSAGLTTNLVITTDRRTYHLLLTSSVSPAMAALSWTYPADDLLVLRRAENAKAVTAPVASSLDLDRLNFAYAISGDRPTWRPIRAFDDGRQTFIEFPPSLPVDEAPPLFALGAKGEVELVNYRVSGRFYVVDRLLALAELRLGAKRQQVVRISRVASPTSSRGGRR